MQVGAGEGPRRREEDGLLRVDRSTISVCKHAQLRAARILGVVSDELPRKAAAPLRLRAAAPGGALASPVRRRGRVRHVPSSGGGLRVLHLHQPDRHGLPRYVAAPYKREINACDRKIDVVVVMIIILRGGHRSPSDLMW
jgi:hypothetical protein